jgi:hypothetical protein
VTRPYLPVEQLNGLLLKEAARVYNINTIAFSRFHGFLAVTAVVANVIAPWDRLAF